MKRPSAETLERALLEAVMALKDIEQFSSNQAVKENAFFAIERIARLTSGYICAIEVSEPRSVSVDTLS